jgi:hypothetical protein
MANRQATVIRYDGPYVDYLQQYHGATFNGRVNLVVSEVPNSDPRKSRITINVRYVVATPQDNFTFNSGQRLEQPASKSGGGNRSA